MSTILKFPKRIVLDPLEAQWAALAGQLRCWDSTIVNDRNETHGSSRNGTWERHIEGAMAEYSVAKCLKMFWPGPGKLFAPNIPVTTEVCHTANSGNKLIVHETSYDECTFWLVTGGKGDYYIEGWLLGRDAKKAEFWNDPGSYGRPAYFVPKSYLNTEYTLEIDKLLDFNLRWKQYAEGLEQENRELRQQLKNKNPGHR
jgi:hypothetical protein